MTVVPSPLPSDVTDAGVVVTEAPPVAVKFMVDPEIGSPFVSNSVAITVEVLGQSTEPGVASIATLPQGDMTRFLGAIWAVKSSLK